MGKACNRHTAVDSDFNFSILTTVSTDVLMLRPVVIRAGCRCEIPDVATR